MYKKFFTAVMTSSKAYRLTMLAMFITHFIFTWTVMQSLFDSPQHIAEHLIVRSFMEAFLLVTVCHFLVRPYLRLNMLVMSISSAMIAKAMVYLILVSTVYFFISFSFGKLDFLSATDISQIQIETQNGVIGGQINLWMIGVLGVGESFITLTTWSVLYLVFKYQKNKKELQEEVNTIHIQQLTSQLSPHFFFNTLNSIRALIFIDQNKASDAITMLSDLLRAQMQSQLKSQSLFKDDWSITKNYLDIETIRFEDRLTVNVNFDDEILEQPIPSLTLLTLTENAVKHGISPSSKPGYVNLRAKKTSAKRWCIEIDNSVYNDVQKHGTQVGLHNVKKRFSLLFGNDFSFIAEKQETKYIVKMDLPYVESVIS